MLELQQYTKEKITKSEHIDFAVNGVWSGPLKTQRKLGFLFVLIKQQNIG